MDQSYSESDVSLSPSKIYERLQMLRQLQLMQRGRLHKLCLQYQHSPEMSSSATEIVSHFSNSTSYNTFRSLLQSSQDTPRALDSNYQANVSPGKDHEQDYIEGVSALNLSQESEFIANSPLSANSRVSANSRSQRANNTSETNENLKLQPTIRNQISLDEMPILSPRKDFEELIIEKLKNETNIKNRIPANVQPAPSNTKRPFLRRGEGMSRFGLKKNNLVIQNTKSLPWRKIKPPLKNSKSDVTSKTLISPLKQKEQANGQILVSETKEQPSVKHVEPKLVDPKSHSALTPPNLASNKQEFKQASSKQEFKQASNKQEFKLASNNQEFNQASNNLSTISTASEPNNNKPIIKTQKQNSQHPLKSTKGQTWATVLTKEQENFLRELKQSDYYKNFVSPAKSIVSDASCDGVLSKLQQERETAEQNMFELLENKVAHESFNIENSFFNRFIRKSNLECSGESTPLVMQRCLYENPNLLNLHQSQSNRCRNDNSCTDAETCSDYTDCSETCSSVSTCCSCKKGEPTRIDQSIELSDKNEKVRKEVDIHVNKKNNEICQNDTVKNDNGVNVEMAEMNAKLIATSEILKDRLRELEDEIDTFRKENTNLSKMREELDLERQKFYEDKSAFEQKYNEEKILSEYYIAEEKEKLNKQKQVYERYVREMRGRLNKKEKDEVINLKKEIAELKEDIRMKDAKSTSTIARLRNQIKIMEKEKKNLQDEVEKLKKENRRIQHSNDITRRLTNLKYLEQINNKLTRMSSKGAQSEADLDRDIKYKAFEIERQSRCKKVQSVINPRRRSKSVPNLNVTSRYAKYFSQKDSISDKDSKLKGQYLDKTSYSDDDGVDDSDKELQNDDMNNFDVAEVNESDDENNLEKIYNERFQSSSVNSKTSSHQDSPNVSPRYTEKTNGNDGFFIQKSTSNRSSKSISKNSLSPFNLSESSSSNNSKSPASILSHKSYRRSKSPINIAKNATVTSDYETNGFTGNAYHNRSKSPVSILSNRTSSHRSATVLNKDLYSDKRMIVSPEPSSSRTSISKTNLNPTEFRKPDGSKELRFPNGNVKHISADGKYSKFVYYNGDVKENFYNEGRIKYFYAETKTYHTTHADGLEVLEFSDGQIEKRYKDGSSEIRLPNGSVRYFDPKNEHVREEWRFPDGAALTVSATGEQRIVFSNGQVEVHAKDHKRREFPDGTVKLVYNDGTSETRYASGRVRIKDKHGNLIMDSASG